MRFAPSKAALLGVLTVVAGWLVLSATAASAHHPIVTGSVGCSPNGVHTVTWTIANSETTSGSNRTMTVTSISVSSGSVTGVAAGTTFPPQTLAGSTKQATTTLPGTQVGPVTITVTASWPSPGPQGVVRTATVELNPPCMQPTTTTTAHVTTTTAHVTTTTAHVTTTTEPTTTTTAPTTTTTAGETTTTTAASTTTTTGGATTTTVADETTTTGGATVLGEQITRGGNLARTGRDLGLLLGVALAAILGAFGARALRRRVPNS